MKKGFMAIIMRVSPTILLLSLLLTAAAQDMPRLVPEAYWGTALIDGNPAKNGSEITAEIQDTPEIVGKGRVINDEGLYSLDVIFDNELTEEDEGAEEGQKLVWRINGIPCRKPAPGSDLANSGKVNGNFTISASTEMPTTLLTTIKSASDTEKTDNSALIWLVLAGILILTGIFYIIARQR